MINLQWLKLLISRTSFDGPKDVRAIEVRLYYDVSRMPLYLSAYSNPVLQQYLKYYFDSNNTYYRILPNYRTYPYKRTVKKFRNLQITTSVLFSLLLYKGICCGYSFELHRQVDAIQMSTHNICLCKESQKKSHSHH